MDYVDAVLFQNRWEAVDDIDAYMMEGSGSPPSRETSPEPDLVDPRRTFADKGCQTPAEWLNSSPSDEAKEAVPEDAPKRKITLRPGTNRPRPRDLLEHEAWRSLRSIALTLDVPAPFAVDPPEPKEARAAASRWYPAAGEPSDASEMLFVAFLVCQVAIDSKKVQNLEAWASDVAKQLNSDGSAPETPEWRMNRSQPGHMIQPVYDAHKNTSFPNGTLEKIAKAMQGWRGDGRYDGLNYEHLKKHRAATDLTGPKLPGGKKPTGPPRIISAALVGGVAKLVKQHGVALRKMITSDAPRGPTIVEERDAALERVEELEEELEDTEAEKKKAKETARKQATRLKAQNTKATAARVDERSKANARVKVQLAKWKEKEQERLAKKAELIKAGIEEKSADTIASAIAKVTKARARARKVESEAKQSRSNLRLRQEADANVSEMRDDLDEMKQALEEARRVVKEPRTNGSSRRDERGRWKAEHWRARVIKWAQLARRVPPSCIAANIADVLAAFAPDTPWAGVAEEELRRMRGEVTVGGEAIAALRMAMAKRFVSFGFDESTKFGKNVLSTNAQLEQADGAVVDVVPRGATLTAGGTAKEISQSIDDKIFAHGRRLLRLWKAAHELEHGAGSWTKAGMPEPEALGLHRLSEHTLLMSDTCNAARACKRLVAEAAERAGRKQIGDDIWKEMSDIERAAKLKSHLGDCHQHLRNIVLNAAAQGATSYLKTELGESLDEFSSFDRMSVDGMDLIRAIFKELHVEGEYAKGKQREADAWRKRYHASAAWAPFERANGSRQDLAFDGAVPIFANRKLILEFLHGIVSVPTHENKLEKFIWHVLSCNEMTALLRTSTLVKLLISEPWRWLCGKASKLVDWSPVKSAEVLDAVEKAFVEIAADGRKLFDPTFDPFAAFAAAQPAFAAWRKQEQDRTVKAPDGTVHKLNELILAEARAPQQSGNVQATETVVALAQRMANAALVAMRDPRRAIADKLSSQYGENAANAENSDEVHEATRGAHVINDYVESTFGCYDAVSRQFRRTTVEHLSGMAQQMRMGDFDRAPVITSDRRKRKDGAEAPEAASEGFFWSGLTDELRASLVEMARHEAADARKAGRAALLAHDEAKLARREERVQSMLDAAVEHYAYALELFNAWEAQGVKTKAEVDRFLAGKPEAQKLEFLRKQIEMRVLGLGWDKFATRWSSQSDTRIGTVAHLRALLVDEIIPEEMGLRRLKKLPTEAAPPHLCRRMVKQLGTLDADALAISQRALFSADELKAKAEQAMQRRVESGVADTVESMQELDPPPFDQQLVGKQLEVLWKYTNQETGEPVLIWATGRVARVADGLNDKRSARARKVLPAGAVLWAWDADPAFDEPAGEQWLLLLPKKWNQQVQYAWRYDPRELGGARATPERPGGVRRACMVDE